MPRLPEVGGDSGNWGAILNDYLLESHTDGGSLKTDSVGPVQLAPNAVTAAALLNGTVTEAKLANNAVTNLKVASNANIDQSKIAGLSSSLAAKADTSSLTTKADDADVVHNSGNEAVAGIKTFTSSPVVPDAAFTIAKTTGLQPTLDAKLPLSQKGAALGVASLDSSATVPLAQIPVQAIATNPILATKYVSVPEGVADGDYPKWNEAAGEWVPAKEAWGTITGVLADQSDLNTALGLKAPLESPTFTGVVTGVTKTHVGLPNVDNTSDINKPVSTAVQAALDAKAPLRSTLNAQTGTSYTPVLSDENKLVTLSNTSAITVTLPQDLVLAFPVGGRIDFAVLDVGAATFVAGPGATVNGTPSLVTRARYSAVTAFKIEANTWLVVGDMVTP